MQEGNFWKWQRQKWDTKLGKNISVWFHTMALVPQNREVPVPLIDDGNVRQEATIHQKVKEKWMNRLKDELYSH